MAGSIALGFSLFVAGDGTVDPIVVDIRNIPIFYFSPDPITNVSQTSAQPLISIDYRVAPTFDILKTTPTGVTIGSFSLVNNLVQFSVGGFWGASIDGYTLTLTPESSSTSVGQVVGILTF
jgi:hypothetical protein